MADVVWISEIKMSSVVAFGNRLTEIYNKYLQKRLWETSLGDSRYWDSLYAIIRNRLPPGEPGSEWKDCPKYASKSGASGFQVERATKSLAGLTLANIQDWRVLLALLLDFFIMSSKEHYRCNQASHNP